jgi:hypothetical protein
VSKIIQQPQNSNDFFEWYQYILFKATEFGFASSGKPHDQKTQQNFLRSCHRGYDHAQQLIVKQINTLRNAGLPKEELQEKELLLRKIVDGIAFVIIGGSVNTCAAWSRNKTLLTVELSEVEKLAELASRKNADNKDVFYLVNDLTSFVHIGDFLRFDSRQAPEDGQRLVPIEVKTGLKNSELVEIVTGDLSICPKETVKQQGEHGTNQLIRMLKQKNAMMNAVEKHKSAIDNRLTEPTWHTNANYYSSNYVDELKTLCSDAISNGTSSACIDDCLHLFAAFNEEPSATKAAMDEILRSALPGLQSHTFDVATGEVVSGKINSTNRLKVFDIFQSNLDEMLCVPFTIWQIPLDYKLKLANRKLAIVGVFDLFAWIEKSLKDDLTITISSRATATTYSQEHVGCNLLTWENRAVEIRDLVGEPSSLFRAIFHSLISPDSVTDTLRSMSKTTEKN